MWGGRRDHRGANRPGLRQKSQPQHARLLKFKARDSGQYSIPLLWLRQIFLRVIIWPLLVLLNHFQGRPLYIDPTKPVFTKVPLFQMFLSTFHPHLQERSQYFGHQWKRWKEIPWWGYQVSRDTARTSVWGERWLIDTATRDTYHNYEWGTTPATTLFGETNMQCKQWKGLRREQWTIFTCAIFLNPWWSTGASIFGPHLCHLTSVISCHLIFRCISFYCSKSYYIRWNQWSAFHCKCTLFTRMVQILVLIRSNRSIILNLLLSEVTQSLWVLMLHTICVHNSINQGLEVTLYLFTNAVMAKSVCCIKQIEILFSFESIPNILIPSYAASFPFGERFNSLVIKIMLLFGSFLFSMQCALGAAWAAGLISFHWSQIPKNQITTALTRSLSNAAADFE